MLAIFSSFTFSILAQTSLGFFGDETEDLIKQVRAYGISISDVTTERLRQFFKDKENRDYIKFMLKQIEFGQEVQRFLAGNLNTNLPSLMDEISKIVRKGLISYATGLVKASGAIKALAWLRLFSLLDTIITAFNIYYQLAKGITDNGLGNLMVEYNSERSENYNGIDLLLELIENGYSLSVVKIICYAHPRSGCDLGNITDAEKNQLAVQLEYSYQSLQVATDPDTKAFIIDSIRLKTNKAPNPVIYLSPKRSATNISLQAPVRFEWSGSDPDGDRLTYIFFFGPCSDGNPRAVEFDLSQTQFELKEPPLEPDKLYCWKVVAEDEFQAISKKSISWRFRTANTPNLKINGKRESRQKQLQTFQLIGANYMPTAMATRHIRGPNNFQQDDVIQANRSGKISWSFKPDCKFLMGTYTIWVTDKSKGHSNVVTQVITPNATDCKPAFSVDKNSKPQGQPFNFNGSFFYPNSGVRIRVQLAHALRLL